MSRIHDLQIASPQADKSLTPPQKRFNTLLRQIGQTRQKLLAWHAGMDTYRVSHRAVVVPIQDELVAGHRRWILALDAALDGTRWAKADAATLRDVLCDAAGHWLSARGADDDIKAIFNKHAPVDFDTSERDSMLAMKDMAEAISGLDLGDADDIVSEEALFQRLQEGFEQHAAAEESTRAAEPTRPRQRAAQQKREIEAKAATQSVREVYRKLASALHPDRESDEAQREAKTRLMQQVNRAYEANDLLALLELQLQTEQIDASHIAEASDQRLKHYNKVLADQLKELKAELLDIELSFCMEFQVASHGPLKPDKLGQLLVQARRHVEFALAEQQRDLRTLGDTAATKRWLKQIRRDQRLAHETDDAFDIPW